ncbi:porimin [Melanerpes formicivorus]|uniref:porimin n=1 Tax=Melanerpes formicivorus TaxID=211600 RepID=UPI00358E217F
MRLLTDACGTLRAAALLLLLLRVPGSRNEEMDSSNSTTPINATSGHKLQGNDSLPVTSSTHPTASTVGTTTDTTHLTNTRQHTSTAVSVTFTSQPTKNNETTGSTTASSVTSQPNITVVTTFKISFTSVTATSKSEAAGAKTSRFDVGSFVGGIVLTLGVLVVLYIGCKTYHSRRGIQYRTIDEHDAII